MRPPPPARSDATDKNARGSQGPSWRLESAAPGLARRPWRLSLAVVLACAWLAFLVYAAVTW